MAGAHESEGESGQEKSGRERRSYERFETKIQVDVTSEDTFLFAYITNISEMGIFVRSQAPLAVGTEVKLRLAAPGDGDGSSALELEGLVVWINPVRPLGDNPNPGMGVRFERLSPDNRERVVDLVRKVAYLQDDAGGD